MWNEFPMPDLPLKDDAGAACHLDRMFGTADMRQRERWVPRHDGTCSCKCLVAQLWASHLDRMAGGSPTLYRSGFDLS